MTAEKIASRIASIHEYATVAAKAATAADYIREVQNDRNAEINDWADRAQEAAKQLADALEMECDGLDVPIPEITVVEDHGNTVWQHCDDDYAEVDEQCQNAEDAVTSAKAQGLLEECPESWNNHLQRLADFVAKHGRMPRA